MPVCLLRNARQSRVVFLPASPWSTLPVTDLPLWPVSRITCLCFCTRSRAVGLGYLLPTRLVGLYLWTPALDCSLSEELCFFSDLLCRIIVRTFWHIHPVHWFLFNLIKPLIGYLWVCAAFGSRVQTVKLQCMCACSGMKWWVYEDRFTSVLGVRQVWEFRIWQHWQKKQIGWICWLRWKIYSAMIWVQGSIALAELTLLLEICFFFPAVSTELAEQIQTVGSIVEQTGEAQCQWH